MLSSEFGILSISVLIQTPIREVDKGRPDADIGILLDSPSATFSNLRPIVGVAIRMYKQQNVSVAEIKTRLEFIAKK